ncbi:unnamed protein product [Cuscuta europaea]|uniref:ubiquitinyl hydrolase 1 n=1 Tax=Cuscuta europaea TaxID=41803 RepID=A0A9P0Z7T8_CUSEU|nr:unnamed protein product [Cuscuta europaea]
MQISPTLSILKLIQALIWFLKTCTKIILKVNLLPGEQGQTDILDGEVCKPLNQMVIKKHILRINGDIPLTDETTSDHERLQKRLLENGFVEHHVKGDGNCQFRALSDEIYGTPEWHNCVREHVANQLRSHPEMYKGHVPMVYDEYLKKMSKSGAWGDHVTLQAAADLFGVKVLVITSFKDSCYLEILPNVKKSEKVINLSFWAEVHYNSVHPKDSPCDFCEREVEVPIL